MGKPPKLNTAKHGHYKPRNESVAAKRMHKPKITAHSVKGPKTVRNKKALAKRIRHLQADAGKPADKAATARLAAVMDVDEMKAIVMNEEKQKGKKRKNKPAAFLLGGAEKKAAGAASSSGMEVEDKSEAAIVNPAIAEAKAKVMALQQRAFFKAQGHRLR